jgi:hypothetical protein
VDKRFEKAIDLLSDFAKDFPLKDPTSDPNIGGTVTGEVKMNDKSKSPSTILQALKNDLHSNVKFPSVSVSLNADGYQPMGYDMSLPSFPRKVTFHLLSSLHDPEPITVIGGCHAINFAPVSDSSARVQRPFKPSRYSVEILLPVVPDHKKMLYSHGEPSFLCRPSWYAASTWGQCQNRPYRGFSA